MGTNRTPRVRTWHPGLVTAEALALFRKLDAVPVPERDEAWAKQSRQLARLLGPMTGSNEDHESAWSAAGSMFATPTSTWTVQGTGAELPWMRCGGCASSCWPR
jgi:hypothetical protein